MKPHRVLYLGGVGPFGGASRSLYEAVSALPSGAVEPYFLMPRGTAMNFYRRIAADGLAVAGLTRLDHTRATHYRGARWLVLLRELGYMPTTLSALRAARRRWPDIDLVHVNEFTEIVAGLFAKRMLGVPLVVHVRSLVHADLAMRRTRWLHRALRKADAVIAIDETVRESLPSDLSVDVIHNSFTAAPIETPDAAYLAQFDRLRPTALKVGFVGNLLRIKGILELVKAAALVRAARRDVQFVIIGGESAKVRGARGNLLRRAGLAQNAEAEVRALIAEAKLEEDVLLFGPTADIQRVYPHMDVLAFPSHFDAPGRPVFEAAFSAVPSIVAVRDPKPDTIVDGETGIAIAAPEPRAIAEAVLRFADDRGEVKRMGANAKALAERNFAPADNARRLLGVYRRLLGTPDA